MKFQSLEQSSGVSIFQEYVIGLNSSLEKNFIKLVYHYKQSLAFCSYTYRPSNLFKIGVIIYSNMILLMLKSCSGYIYDCFLCLVLHLMGFHGFWCSMVLIFYEKVGVIAEKEPLAEGARRSMWLRLPFFAQTAPVTVLLAQPVSVDKRAGKKWCLRFQQCSCTVLGYMVWNTVFMINYRAGFFKKGICEQWLCSSLGTQQA